MSGYADQVLREFSPIGKYRVRMVRTVVGGKVIEPTLDIREYVSTEQFEGFTRRGIRLGPVQLGLLRDSINEILEGETLDNKKKGDLPDIPMVGIKADSRKGGSMEEVTQRMTCGLCAKEMLRASGFDADNLPLCGKCNDIRIRAVQRVCRHETMREYECTDCGLKEKSVKRAIWTTLGFGKTAVVGIAKVFAMYWLPSLLGSTAMAAVLYFLGKKFGIL